MKPSMTDAIASHRAAWQAFQDAPTEDQHPDTINAAFAEFEALNVLLGTAPQDHTDLVALQSHLDWWVMEEAQRIEMDPAPFALHAALRLARAADVSTTAKALVDAVTFDEAGMMVAGEWKGGNGGLLSRETIIAADNCRRALEARG